MAINYTLPDISNVQNRATIDSMPDNLKDFRDNLQHQSSKINDTTVASFHSEWISESEDDLSFQSCQVCPEKAVSPGTMVKLW